MNILIKNGKVIDGTGNPWYYADIEIEDGKIKRMERKLEIKADKVINAEKLVVTPGFISHHGHVDGYMLFHPDMEPVVTQGITTTTMGHCGYSAFPDKQSYAGHACSHLFYALWYGEEVAKSSYDWHSLNEYRELVKSLGGIPIDVVPVMGHGTIRWKAGVRPLRKKDVRKPTSKEIKKMKELTKQGMEEGAFGLSESMDYAPNRYAEEDEIVELAKIVARYNGVLDPHCRNLASPEGIKEMIEIAKKTGVQLHIAHISNNAICRPGDTNVFPESFGVLERARAEGMDITTDVIQTVEYGFRVDILRDNWYRACESAPKRPKGAETYESYLKNLKKPKFREEVKRAVIEFVKGEYFEFLFRDHADLPILINTENPEIENKPLGEIAKKIGVKPDDLFFDLTFGASPIIAEGVKPSIIFDFEPEEDVAIASQHWLAMPAEDQSPRPDTPELTPWPGAYYIMPRFFNNFIYPAVSTNVTFQWPGPRGQNVEQAIRKMTSFPAQAWGLYDRGILRPGMKADIVIFDPVEYRERSTRHNPCLTAVGMYYVMVNGKLVLNNKKLTAARPGEVLSKKDIQ